MNVRKICAVLSLAFIVSGAWLAMVPAGAGELVARTEVERAMGACGVTFPDTPVVVCYGGTCLSCGCGCTVIDEIVEGQYAIDAATPCDTAYCTAPQGVSDQPCSG
jgi:hypothetical protein